MKLILCIDDTDNLESKGTGTIASELKQRLVCELGADADYITRHQLLLHRSIRYTSHNSSMAFTCRIEADRYDDVVQLAGAHLRKESAEGSDPGLAILNTESLHNTPKKQRIIDYGYAAKRQVLTKDDAWHIAEELGIYLDEFGGTGEGIIGALAGIGLRLSGNDGEVKGRAGGFEQGATYRIADLLRHKDIDDVQTVAGDRPGAEETVTVPWLVKQTIRNRQRIVLVQQKNGIWHTMAKDDLRMIDQAKAELTLCAAYRPDVEEERYDDNPSCLNCRYRRWEALHFTCTKGER